MARAYLGLGSNLGDRVDNLRSGVAALVAAPEVVIVGVSGVYHSEPVGMTDQPEFLNAVVAVETALKPDGLLEVVQEIERKQGRQRIIRWGPRTLDVDILLYGEVEIQSERLTIPHSLMRKRRFVIEPLLEIAPDCRLPDGTRVADLLQEIGSDQAVWRDRDLVIGS